jgi:hypothetical protein
MAGAQSFERGEGYFAGGRVRNVAEDRGKIAAEVRGSVLQALRRGWTRVAAPLSRRTRPLAFLHPLFDQR